MSDWNPDLYLKFERERTQPVRDLVARIENSGPARILDVGCGPGNSTAVLRERWPEAHVVGLDCSPSMIEKARITFPNIDWVQADAGGELSNLGLFDLLFANASLQWLPNHRELMPRLLRSVKPGGTLAVQIPKFEEMPVAVSIREACALPKYAGFFAGFESGIHLFDEALYYETLKGLCRSLDLWVTHYYHVLENHAAILDWIKSTALRPYLDKLPGDLRSSFLDDLLPYLKRSYAPQADGRVFFVFKRFFFIAHNR